MDKSRIKELLVKEKKKLLQLIDRIISEDNVDSESWKSVNELGDEAGETLSLLSKQELLETLRILLRRTEQSLVDLKEDRYGICNRCERRITEQRLLAKPNSQYCLECQKIIDNQNS